MRRPGRWGWVAVLALAACGRSAPQAGLTDRPGPGVAPERARTYAEELNAAEQRVRASESRAASKRAFWPALEELALARLARAQLSGRHEDYLDADRALQDALAADARAACAGAARIHFALHRLPAAARALTQCQGRLRSSAQDEAELLGLAGDVAFQRGRYDEALSGYHRALEVQESFAGLARLSQYYAKTGAPTEAAALLDRADKLYHGDSQQPRAWLRLQQGLLALDRGRWDDALAHYLSADRQLSGWWLVQEHIAEVHALRGELDAAQALYERIVQQTGHPEYMDALARLHLARGQAERAAQWVERARQHYRRRLEALPEAAAAHALNHFLSFEPLERDLVLRLAQRNLQARPGAEARILLAKTQLRLGRPKDALATLRTALESPWNTAELHALAAQIHAAAGDTAAAAQARLRALEMNPHAMQVFDGGWRSEGRQRTGVQTEVFIDPVFVDR